jgi:hypothetical protein
VRRRDPIATWNERVKLLAVTLNAVAIGLLGFAVLRPATEDVAMLSFTSGFWAVVGLAFHGFAHYVLSMLRKEAEE